MKKILSIALVALLAASAFAGFTGSANVDFGFDTENPQKWGFKNGTKTEVKVDLMTGSVDQKAEGDVYAGIAAEFSIKWDSTKAHADNPVFASKISKAYITDGNWELSILGVNAASNYAKSAIDFDVKDKPYNYAIPTVKDVPGIAFSMAGYKASFGIKGTKDTDLETSVTFETPAYELAEGFTLGVAANYAYKMEAKATKSNAFGASVKTAYENDTFSLSVASDLGYDIQAEKFGADVAAKLSVSPVVVDFYYATLAKAENDPAGIKNLLSAQVATDLTAFDVPLQLTVAGKDLINSQDLSAEVVVPFAPFTFKVFGGYVIQDKDWNVGGDVKYAHDLFTVAAGVVVEGNADTDAVRLGANASISSSALVPGATLSLAWKDSPDPADASKTLDMDLLNKHYGQVVASCKIGF